MRTRWILVGIIWATAATLHAINRYPVGQPVPSEVYTAPLDPCDPDPAHKFLPLPPKDWAVPFGNNERTMLIHAVSELRVVVASQAKRLLELEKLFASAFKNSNKIAVCQICEPWSGDPNDSAVCLGHGTRSDLKYFDPNEVKLPDDVVVRPNEAKE